MFHGEYVIMEVNDSDEWSSATDPYYTVSLTRLRKIKNTKSYYYYIHEGVRSFQHMEDAIGYRDEMNGLYNPSDPALPNVGNDLIWKTEGDNLVFDVLQKGQAK